MTLDNYIADTMFSIWRDITLVFNCQLIDDLMTKWYPLIAFAILGTGKLSQKQVMYTLYTRM